ncbi:helix-turn-helix domain-containing protein [Bradyrhizobium sp. Pa8]|uniref:helix-turn-helix domain-containing protein n=1 Tax=Bradyrhizobium sp. Pa8 TaxID=3386552 RepID=UPI00403F40C7
MTGSSINSAPDLAERFRRRAIELGLTQREVDDLARLSSGYFATICSGSKIPGGEIIVRICAALQIELWLVERVGE